jgi:hypothetical protein
MVRKSRLVLGLVLIEKSSLGLAGIQKSRQVLVLNNIRGLGDNCFKIVFIYIYIENGVIERKCNFFVGGGGSPLACETLLTNKQFCVGGGGSPLPCTNQQLYGEYERFCNYDNCMLFLFGFQN